MRENNAAITSKSEPAEVSGSYRPGADALVQRPARPILGLLIVSALIVSTSTFPYLALRRRLTRADGMLSRLVSTAAKANHEQAADIALEQTKTGTQLERLRLQADRVAGDVRDIRNIVLKERDRVAALEARFDVFSEQLKAQEQRILASLDEEQTRSRKTDAEIKELRKTADKNASNLSKVGGSLADIAAFIDLTEIEQGILPDRDKESSRRVNAMRRSALDLVE